MATRRSLERLQTLIWVLIYGGLLGAVLGVFTRRYDEALGSWLLGTGTAVALVGAGLIVVRARLREEDGA